MSVKYLNYVNLTSSSEEQPNERTSSPPPRKKSVSLPQAPSESISSKSTHYTSSSSPSESPTPTHVAPPHKLHFVIPIKQEPQEIPLLQMSPNDPYAQTIDNWPSGPFNPSSTTTGVTDWYQSHGYREQGHAYDAIIPSQVPIPAPIIVPPSPMLSLIFNHQEFFVPEELVPPKEQVSYPTSSSTNLSNPSQKQACTLVPQSFSAYTPTPPQIFEIGKSSIKMHLKHHEKQTEDILNYLEELSFHRIEKIEQRLVNDWMIIQRDFDELKTELEKVRS
nr:hypothetical protein [Tanacetum cinerariifolium]